MSLFACRKSINIFLFDFRRYNNTFIIVAIEQGSFPNRRFLCFFDGTEHFFSELPYKSKKNIPCQKYDLVKWKWAQPEMASYITFFLKLHEAIEATN